MGSPAKCSPLPQGEVVKDPQKEATQEFYKTCNLPLRWDRPCRCTIRYTFHILFSTHFIFHLCSRLAEQLWLTAGSSASPTLQVILYGVWMVSFAFKFFYKTLRRKSSPFYFQVSPEHPHCSSWFLPFQTKVYSSSRGMWHVQKLISQHCHGSKALG